MNVERWIRVIAGTFVLVSPGWGGMFPPGSCCSLFVAQPVPVVVDELVLMEKILDQIGVPER